MPPWSFGKEALGVTSAITLSFESANCCSNELIRSSNYLSDVHEYFTLVESG